MNRAIKNSIVSISVITGILMALPTMALAADAGVTVEVNGQTISSTANHLKSYQTYVDLKAFANAAGISYSYDKSAGTASINGKEVKVEVSNGMPTAYIRDLAAAAGADKITWDKKTQTADIVFSKKLVVYGDVVSENAGCVLQSRYSVGDAIVFRAKVINPVTGQLATDAKLQVHLSTGEVLDMQLGTHPPQAPNPDTYWTLKYEVTDKTPQGTLNYYVTAETNGLKGEFHPFNAMPSLITIVPAVTAAPSSADSAPAGN